MGSAPPGAMPGARRGPRPRMISSSRSTATDRRRKVSPLAREQPIRHAVITMRPATKWEEGEHVDKVAGVSAPAARPVRAVSRAILLADLSITVDSIMPGCVPLVSPPESWLWHIIVWILCLVCLGLGILLGRMSREK